MDLNGEVGSLCGLAISGQSGHSSLNERWPYCRAAVFVIATGTKQVYKNEHYPQIIDMYL